MKELKLKIPEKLLVLYSTLKRYIVIFGGRGSSKSWTVADFLILKAYESEKRILCTREIQKSIKDSVHKLICDRIKALGLESFFVITDRAIRGTNGSEFIFAGLKHNPDIIKSMEGIDYAWCEEAQSLSRKSLEVLTPTIRKPGSQIIFTYNPTDEEDPVHVDYTLADRDDTIKIEINYNDNPFFPDVLKEELEYDKRTDYDKYLHKWEGKCIKHSEAQVFYGKWEVNSFEAPEDTFFYFGADWGFSKDPSTLVRCFIIDRILYIDYEFYEVGVEIDKLPGRFEAVPESKIYPIKADSARPDTISYMKRHGYNKMSGSKKGKGSIEDGIEFIKSFEKIVINPRCKNTIDEFRYYSYVVDPRTGNMSNKIEDKNNHIIDALRYALEDLMRHKKRNQKAPSKNLNQVIGW